MAQEVQNGGAEKAVKFSAFKPQLMVEAPKASDAVQFYKEAFGAVEASRTVNNKRKAEEELPHISAQLEIAGSTVVVSDAPVDSLTAKTDESGLVFCLETEDVEAAIAKAVTAGAVQEGEVADGDGACCGGRVGKLKDPYGFVWLICSPAKKCVDVEA